MEPTANDNGKKPDSKLDDAIAKVAVPVSGSTTGFPSSPTDKTKGNRKTKRHWLGWLFLAFVFLIIAAIAAVAIGWKMGYLYGGKKTPEQTVTVHTVVCDSDMVNRYNSQIAIPVSTPGENDFLDLVNEIRSNSDYVDDPTCQTIIFQYGFTTNNREEMLSAATALKDLNEQGIFANNNIIGALPLTVMMQLASLGDTNIGEDNTVDIGGGE